jgi:WD40 repeat protein
VAFSKDGKTLATGSEDGSILLWDMGTRKLRATLTGNTQNVESVAFSPDGKVLAAGGYGFDFGEGNKQLTKSPYRGTAKLWDVRAEKELATLEDECWVKALAFSPDGKVLAGGGHWWPQPHGGVVIWDAATFKKIATLSGHSDRVNRVVFSPDGKTLASCSSDKTLRLWDWKMNKEILTLEPSDLGIWDVAFSPDGKTLASTDGRTLTLWDVAQGKERTTVETSGRPIFSPDGKTLATILYISGPVKEDFSEPKGEIHFHDAATGEIREKIPLDVVPESAAFSPDGKILAVACRGKERVSAKGQKLGEPRLVEGEVSGSIRLFERVDKK